jgi:hypothetical protein
MATILTYSFEFCLGGRPAIISQLRGRRWDLVRLGGWAVLHKCCPSWFPPNQPNFLGVCPHQKEWQPNAFAYVMRVTCVQAAQMSFNDNQTGFSGVRTAVRCHLLTTGLVTLTTQRDVRKDTTVAHRKAVLIRENNRKMSFTDNRTCCSDNTARCQKGQDCGT